MNVFHKIIIFLFLFSVFKIGFCQQMSDTVLLKKEKVFIEVEASAIIYNINKSKILNHIDFFPQITVSYNKTSFFVGPMVGKVLVDYLIAPKYNGNNIKGIILGCQYKKNLNKKINLFFQYNAIGGYIHYKSYLDEVWFPPFYGNHIYSNFSISNTLGYEIKFALCKHVFLAQGVSLGWGFGMRIFDFDNNNFDSNKKYSGYSGLATLGVGYNFLKN